MPRHNGEEGPSTTIDARICRTSSMGASGRSWSGTTTQISWSPCSTRHPVCSRTSHMSPTSRIEGTLVRRCRPGARGRDHLLQDRAFGPQHADSALEGALALDNQLRHSGECS